MAGLGGLLGWVVAGREGLIWAGLLGLGLLLFLPRMSPERLLRMQGARRLHPAEAPALFQILGLLCQEAALPRCPDLYYVPSPERNAFAVAGPSLGGAPAALACTDGLLRALTLRELTAVLAHELSHIRHGDMRVMTMADVAGRITSAFALTGQALLLVHLPWLMVEEHPVPWLAIAILLAAPSLSALMQLALSRSREYEADLEAARLSGDPLALADALERMARPRPLLLERLLGRSRAGEGPSLLRTHPDTAERVARLRQLAREEPASPLLERLGLLAPPSAPGNRGFFFR